MLYTIQSQGDKQSLIKLSEIVKFYNKIEEGADTFDHLSHGYMIERKTRR